ncbi:hypothetical protein H1C71_035134, partial [Ictidomys tridecemlineatus]
MALALDSAPSQANRILKSITPPALSTHVLPAHTCCLGENTVTPRSPTTELHEDSKNRQPGPFTAFAQFELSVVRQNRGLPEKKWPFSFLFGNSVRASGEARHFETQRTWLQIPGISWAHDFVNHCYGLDVVSPKSSRG